MSDNGVTAAGKVANNGGPSRTNEDKDTLALMRSRLTSAMSVLSDSREDEVDDLRFMAGSSDNLFQWGADVLSSRGATGNNGQTINARPCLTINKLPQHVRQVTNEQRQNRPSGKVIPADDKADVEVAAIFDGMVKHIEYMSDADVAYDTACENQVTYGEGYFRILTEYCDPESFNQDLRIGRIRNSFSVYMDPMMQDPCGSDAQWCFITQDMLKTQYEKEFPNATPITTLMAQGVGNESPNSWLAEDTIRIAEYFYFVNEPATLNLYPGNISCFEGSEEDKARKAVGLTPLKSRRSDRRKVMWMKTNGFEKLEEREWAGKWIPVIRVIGNEFEIEGQMYISGLIRNAKDPQRLYNYWASQEAEMLALAPKAPFIGYGGQFEGYEDKWKTANTQNWPYLEINPDVTDGAGAVLPLPQRAQPPMASSGLLQAKAGAADDIKSTTGQYDSSLGQTSNERSGKAILAREKQSDTGTYHYVDNLARAIRYGTRQLVDLIPKIYDTERVARIVGLDGTIGMVKINPDQPEPVKKIVDENGIVLEKIYNPTVGVYDVCVTTGPSYMTKRQEAREQQALILQTNPQLWSVAGDLFVKNMDWPGAQELADRLKKTIDPKLLDNDSPEMQAAQLQIKAMGQEMEQMHQMLREVQTSFEARDLAIKEMANHIKAYDAETKRISAVQPAISEEQMQDIVMGTLHAAMESGDLIASGGERVPVMEPQEPEPMPAGEAPTETPE